MPAPFCILRLRPSRASGKHAPASRQCQPRHFCAVSGRQPTACAAQAGKSADMAEKSMQKIYGIIVSRHVDLSRELALRQDKALEVRRSRRKHHRRVRHKIDDPVRDRARDLQDLHVQPQQHFHIRNDRHAEALRDEPGDHLILLDLIRDIGRGVDLRKHIVDDVPQPRTVRILDKQIAELLLQLRDGVAQARLRYSDRGR